jgi:hypothetical protein
MKDSYVVEHDPRSKICRQQETIDQAKLKMVIKSTYLTQEDPKLGSFCLELPFRDRHECLGRICPIYLRK